MVTLLLPEAKNFILLDEPVEIQSLQGKMEKVDIYKAMSGSDECVGWSFEAAGSGFADKIKLVIALDKDFEKIAGFDVLSSNETPGFGDQIKYDYWRPDKIRLLPGPVQGRAGRTAQTCNYRRSQQNRL